MTRRIGAKQITPAEAYLRLCRQQERQSAELLALADTVQSWMSDQAPDLLDLAEVRDKLRALAGRAELQHSPKFSSEPKP